MIVCDLGNFAYSTDERHENNCFWFCLEVAVEQAHRQIMPLRIQNQVHQANQGNWPVHVLELCVQHLFVTMEVVVKAVVQVHVAPALSLAVPLQADH